MDRFEALTAFVAVADEGSFAGAARSMNQSPASVTRAIAGLEAHLGVSLFHRSTRVVALSHEGAALLERARPLIADMREAEHLLMGGAAVPRGEIHITTPVMFGRLHVLPVVARLLAEHDGLSARMMLIDRNVRIIEEGVDVAVRIGHLDDSSLMAVKIGSVRQLIVASPAYLAKRGTPRNITDLAKHDSIAGAGIRFQNVWRFGPRGEKTVTMKPRFSLNSIEGTVAAAEAGAGVANVLSYQVASALEKGCLVSLIEEEIPPPLPVQLLYHASRAAMPSVRLFIDSMKEKARTGSWR